MISYSSSGSFANTLKFLEGLKNIESTIMTVLESCGQEGVAALRANTPKDSGLAADSWSYKVEKQGRIYSIAWMNRDVENGYPVAIMIQYGHGTGTGGWVQGQDYINPAMKPVFDSIANRVWKAVTSA